MRRRRSRRSLRGRPTDEHAGDVRSTPETALSFGPRSREVAIRRVLAKLPNDGEIVTAEELAWAMHAELCDWKFHTTACWNHWRARAATILAAAQEGPE
jgi:hypothetical protein